MERTEVEEVVARYGVVTMKADKTNENPEADAMLKELGNAGAVVPFLAIFPGDNRDPITFDGPVTMQNVLDALSEAGASSKSP